MIQALRYGLLYFLLVFGAGFLLAPVRELVLAPRVGLLWAELIEMPVMLAVILFVARWLAARPGLRDQSLRLVVCGLFALSLMLVAEYGVVHFVRDLSLVDYIRQREPVSGTVYLVMLALFAVAPRLFRIRGKVGGES